MKNNTSLAKSHSKSSNAKLTLLCLFSIVCFSALWVFLAMFNDLDKTISLIGTITSGVLTFLCLLMFNSFKR